MGNMPSNTYPKAKKETNHVALGDGPHYGCGRGGRYGWSFNYGPSSGSSDGTCTPAQTASFEPAEDGGGGAVKPLIALTACGFLAALAVGLFKGDKD
jgi:hypothetical protein